jgi:hypothetical protein
VNQRKDRGIHLVIYVIAGAAMGGFLDVTAFDQPTPGTGIVLGAVIGVLYCAFVRFSGRRSRRG